ncbi:DUF4878 domain-containing protein [Pleionea litopenaei]|uniref:DUF4878 domain-containing protein n=1 Tax=Pleionea litopenaei TaxID=3070815 RepID=A0AA51RRE9_9GAMM|nr:DUF4878 domain-containing protein [Pleionea sp. HL-JVS1]WMS86283.1 DUF4878 domain-containing protein [Pleionea sp. HL-JVS1]
MLSLSSKITKSIAVSFIMLLTACGVDQSNPEVVAQEYVEAIYFANLPRFKEIVEPDDYDANDDHKLFVAKDSTAKSNTRKHRGGIALVQVSDSYVKDNRARVRVNVEFNNGERRVLSISLHMKDGNWYVNPTSWARW